MTAPKLDEAHSTGLNMTRLVRSCTMRELIVLHRLASDLGDVWLTGLLFTRICQVREQPWLKPDATILELIEGPDPATSIGFDTESARATAEESLRHMQEGLDRAAATINERCRFVAPDPDRVVVDLTGAKVTCHKHRNPVEIIIPADLGQIRPCRACVGNDTGLRRYDISMSDGEDRSITFRGPIHKDAIISVTVRT